MGYRRERDRIKDRNVLCEHVYKGRSVLRASVLLPFILLHAATLATAIVFAEGKGLSPDDVAITVSSSIIRSLRNRCSV